MGLSVLLRSLSSCETIRLLLGGRPMILNSIERDFLARLSLEPWTSPPVFDHRLLARLVENKYVASHTAALDAVYYEITDYGRAAIVDAG
jgi:hypothetical protein